MFNALVFASGCDFLKLFGLRAAARYIVPGTRPAAVTCVVLSVASMSVPALLADDGSANAPVGTPPLIGLLNGYAVRPRWAVAGVDYYVGTPSGTALRDPSTISMQGVSVNRPTSSVQVSG